jgi:hypothetical protein
VGPKHRKIQTNPVIIAKVHGVTGVTGPLGVRHNVIELATGIELELIQYLKMLQMVDEHAHMKMDIEKRKLKVHTHRVVLFASHPILK